MDKNNLNERRCSERVLLSAPQELNAEGAEGLYLVGLSRNGAEIACQGDPNWSGSVRFCLPLPPGIHTILLTGEIVWEKKKNKWHAGLKFVSLSKVDKQILEAYMDYLKRDNELQKIHETLKVNLRRLMGKLDRLAELKNLTTGASTEPVYRQKPRYLH